MYTKPQMKEELNQTNDQNANTTVKTAAENKTIPISLHLDSDSTNHRQIWLKADQKYGPGGKPHPLVWHGTLSPRTQRPSRDWLRKINCFSEVVFKSHTISKHETRIWYLSQHSQHVSLNTFPLLTSPNESVFLFIFHSNEKLSCFAEVELKNIMVTLCFLLYGRLYLFVAWAVTMVTICMPCVLMRPDSSTTMYRWCLLHKKYLQMKVLQIYTIHHYTKMTFSILACVSIGTQLFVFVVLTTTFILTSDLSVV